MTPNDQSDDPLDKLSEWVERARSAGCGLPEAMALATTSSDGTPSVRYVLCRGVDSRGIQFYTNYESAKAQALEETKRASVAFHWEQIHRQVRIDGSVRRVDAEVSQTYFNTRSRESRISAWASPQSHAISTSDLEQRWADAERRFHGVSEIPLPPYWGGYEITALRVELWRQGDNRLHDRTQYSRATKTEPWTRLRLAP